MKNLFEFATKELSQDAFLRWLFENYDCEDEEVKKVSRNLLLEFINDDKHKYKIDDIKKLWTKAQDHKADIVVHVEMNDGYKIGIIIEDKTFSSEHNQLRKYMRIFENDQFWKDNTNERKYVFYKTSFIHEWERQRIHNAEWNLFDLDRISGFWSDYLNSPNKLIRWYAEYANKIKGLYSNTELTYDRNAKYNSVAWFGFFKNVLERKYEKDYKVYVDTSTYGYSLISFRPRIEIAEEDYTPYIEIASRFCNDFENNKIYLDVRFLSYGLEWRLSTDDVEKYKAALRYSINRTKKYYFVEDPKLEKQLAHVNPIEVENKQEFLNYLDEILYEFKLININANLNKLNLNFIYNKSLYEKLKILEDIDSNIKQELESKNLFKKHGLFNADLQYKTYSSLYVDIEDNGLTIEPYIMVTPTNKTYEQGNILYIAIWNRSNQNYNFDKYIYDDSEEVVTAGKNAWGKHYILKKYDLLASKSETIVEDASKYIIDFIIGIK